MNLFQTWFKLAITTMIKLRLHELIAGCYTPPPLKEILSRDYKHIGGLQKRYTHITTEGETLNTWNGGNPRSPM
jgi:hypothetical protein